MGVVVEEEVNEVRERRKRRERKVEERAMGSVNMNYVHSANFNKNRE